MSDHSVTRLWVQRQGPQLQHRSTKCLSLTTVVLFPPPPQPRLLLHVLLEESPFVPEASLWRAITSALGLRS